jgi:lactoylglutathione lyase
MRYAATILYVPDVPAAVDFYRSAFDLVPTYVAPDGGYAEFDAGGARLGLDSETLADEEGPPCGYQRNRRAGPPAGVEIMFTSDDLLSDVERAVAAGAELLDGPRQKSWGQEIAYVRDPWGILVAIATPWRAPDVD